MGAPLGTLTGPWRLSKALVLGLWVRAWLGPAAVGSGARGAGLLLIPILGLFPGKREQLPAGGKSPSLCHHPAGIAIRSCALSPANGTAIPGVHHGFQQIKDAWGPLGTPWPSSLDLPLFGGGLWGRNHALIKRGWRNSCGCLELKPGYEQTTAASRCDSSGCGMEFHWIRLNYEH